MKLIILFCLIFLISFNLLAENKENTDKSISLIPSKETIYAELEWLLLDKEIQKSWIKKSHLEKENWLTISSKNRQPDVDTYKIMAVISKKSSSYNQAINKILEVLQQHHINTHITLLNINKNKGLAKSAVEYAEKNNIDLFLSMGSTAMGFFATEYSSGKIPVVTSTNKDPVFLGYASKYKGGNKGSIAFTSLNISLDIQLDYLRTLKPNLKAIGILYNQNHKQVMDTEVIPSRAYFKNKGIKLIEVAVSSPETAAIELQDKLPVAIESFRKIDSELKNVLFWVSSSTAIFSNINHINDYSKNIPVISSIPNAVKKGEESAVLAIGIDRRNNAHLAALYIVDILTKGKKPDDFDVGIVTPPDISINFLVAKKIGLKIPFRFIESANFIYDHQGNVIRNFGKRIAKNES